MFCEDSTTHPRCLSQTKIPLCLLLHIHTKNSNEITSIFERSVSWNGKFCSALSLTHESVYFNMEIMKVTVCQMRDEVAGFKEDWNRLVEHTQREKLDLILLPEMAFSPRFATDPRFVPDIWQKAVSAHDEAEKMIKGLSPSCVLGSRPANSGGKRLNQAFAWIPDSGLICGFMSMREPMQKKASI